MSADVPLFDTTMKKKKKKPRSKPLVTPDVVSQESSTTSDANISTETSGNNEANVNEVQETSNEQAPGEKKNVNDVNEYTYEFLLSRAFDLIGQSKPGKTRIKIPPPQAFRIGTSRTLWSNFPQIAAALHRSPQHLLNFVIVELGTTANLDGNGRLVIKGRFMPKQLETLIRNYLAEYVVCKTCKSRDTELKKENRLHFLVCQSSLCGSVRSVPPLNKGYVHNIKRAKNK